MAALLASTATGAALAQGATAPMGSDSRWSVSAEALFAWFKSSPTPVPIITDSYADAPGVNVLLGGGSVDTNPNAGFKLTGAYRIDSRLGVELSGFYIPTRTTSSSVSSTGQPGSIDLLLPFFDVTINQENVTEISFWPEYRGSAQATLSNNLGGGELNVTWAMPPQDAWRVDLLGGFRFLQLRESYTITTSSPYNPPNPVDIWNTTDSFDARNRFYGLQVGARAAYDQGPWVGSVSGKLALGTMQQRVSVNGFLETNDYNNYGPTQTFSGGTSRFRRTAAITRATRSRWCRRSRSTWATGSRPRPRSTSAIRSSTRATSRVRATRSTATSIRPRPCPTATTRRSRPLARRNRPSASIRPISGRRPFPSAWRIASSARNLSPEFRVQPESPGKYTLRDPV